MSNLPGFVGPSYQSASLNADAQRAVNLFPELVESGSGINRYVYYGAPGKHLWATLPTLPVRGLWAGDNRLFAVGGSILYEVASNGTATALGNVGNDNRRVQMFPNGNQLFIVSAGKGWIADGIGSPDVVEVTAAIGGARTGCFLDGYFIVNPPGTKQYFLSTLNDGSQWDPLDFFSKEGYPDYIAAILADHEELWLFGNETTEAHRNEGDANFTFQRDPGAFNHMGIAAYDSPVRLEQGPAWLAADARGKIFAVQAVGFMPKRVSTHAIEAKWDSYATVADAESFQYYEHGHWFWQITFPTANATWVYDTVTQLWHERAWWDGAAFQRDRARCHAYVFGKHLVGDWENGKIYEQAQTITDDFGDDRKYLRTAPHINSEKARIRHSSLQVDLETGGGAITGVLRVSDDAGHTYKTPKTCVAPAGKYRARINWRRLGEARDRVYEFSMVTQERAAILNAYLHATASPVINA